MEMLFLRIISLVLSLLMFLFNSVSAIFPGLFPETPPENTVSFCEENDFEILKSDKIIISDYVSWLETANETLECFEEYNWKYFFTGSVVLVKVVLPNPDCTVEIESVSENEEVLDLDYKIIYPDEINTDVLDTKIILVNVSKNISEIDALGELIMPAEPDIPDIPEDPEEPEEPEEPEKYTYTLCGANIFNDPTYNQYGYYSQNAEEFYDYDSWKAYYAGSDERLDRYNADYFKENALAVFYINVPYKNKEINIHSIFSGNYNSVDMTFRVSDSEKEVPAGTTAVVVEIAKSEEGGYSYDFGLMDEARVLRSDYLNKFIRKDGYVEIVSTVSEWMSFNTREYYSRVYNLNKTVFDERSLALITVAVPNRDYGIKLEQTKKSENTVEISYTLYTEEDIYYEDPDLVYYYVIAAEIPKDTKTVNIKENGFKNKWLSLDYIFVNEPTLISDYETFISVCNNNSGRLSKYDESYFENYSLVAIGGSAPDSGHDFEMLKVKETGDTLELVYGINDIFHGGLTVIMPKAALIEVSKNIKNISAVRKDIQNYHIKYDELYNFNLDRTPVDETFLISDFETWKQYLSSDSNEFERYNEEYFKNYSVVLLKITLPSSGSGSDIRYLYEEDNALQVGYNIFDDGGFGMICYNVVLVEVSKDITQIQITELE